MNEKVTVQEDDVRQEEDLESFEIPEGVDINDSESIKNYIVMQEIFLTKIRFLMQVQLEFPGLRVSITTSRKTRRNFEFMIRQRNFPELNLQKDEETLDRIYKEEIEKDIKCLSRLPAHILRKIRRWEPFCLGYFKEEVTDMLIEFYNEEIDKFIAFQKKIRGKVDLEEIYKDNKSPCIVRYWNEKK